MPSFPAPEIDGVMELCTYYGIVHLFWFNSDFSTVCKQSFTEPEPLSQFANLLICYVHLGWLPGSESHPWKYLMYLFISSKKCLTGKLLLTCDNVSREYMLMSLQNWKMSHTPLTSGALARMCQVALLSPPKADPTSLSERETNIIREKMFTSQCFRFLATRWSPAVARRGDHLRNVRFFWSTI